MYSRFQRGALSYSTILYSTLQHNTFQCGKLQFELDRILRFVLIRCLAVLAFMLTWVLGSIPAQAQSSTSRTQTGQIQASQTQAGQTQAKPVAARVLEVTGEITPNLAGYIVRELKRAENDGVPLVVVELDTPGGRVDAAIQIADALLATTVPTLAVVKNAFSAGALIALASEQLVMLPGSEIGAALPVTTNGEAIDGSVGEKVNSAVRSKFRAVAQARARPAELAEAMVNPNSVIPGLKERGEILTLTAADAVRLQVANAQARTLPDALETAGFGRVPLERLEPSTAEQVGAFLAQPVVAAILLAVGIIGLLIELLHPGLVLPGVTGGLALAAYFAGPFLSGNGSGVAFILFIAGLLFLAAELLFIPGFGVAGIIGAAGIIASVYLSFGDSFVLVAGLSVILVGIGVGLVFTLVPSTRFARRVALQTSLAGATANVGLSRLVGRFGLALSDLRPAGLADLEGERVDVVTEGEYIVRGTRLEVVRVEGARVVVRAVHTDTLRA